MGPIQGAGCTQEECATELFNSQIGTPLLKRPCFMIKEKDEC